MVKKTPLEAGTATAPDSTKSEGSVEIGACSLCHCALDFSDRAAFFKEDREEDYKDGDDDDDSYFFRKNDPYLPESLWDTNNALVYCDSCERMYHQKCHFVPVIALPRGAWHCLYCQSQKQADGGRKSKSPKPKKAGKKKLEPNLLEDFFKALDSADLGNVTTTTGAESSNRDSLFVSPPVNEAAEWEKKWEAASRHLKAAAWQSLFTQLRNAISGQLSSHRLARAGLETWTSTSNNFHFFQNSQELHDTLIKWFGAEYRIRNWLLSIEAKRSTWPAERSWQTLLNWTLKHQKDQAEFIKRVLFPFGWKHQRRIEPKSPEFRLHEGEAMGDIPRDVVVDSGKAKKSTRSKKQANGTPRKRSNSKVANDDDSGISLDDLACCICTESYATDENDLVLCDGNGCFRAYHQYCVKPVLKLGDDDDDDDWFCPLCAGKAELIQHVQNECMGDEWEQRRIDRQIKLEELKKSKRKTKLKDALDDSSSLRSWCDVDEVFPNADRDYSAAVMLRRGKRNAATAGLVSRVLGLSVSEEDDDDDEDDDGNFDLDSYQEDRIKQRDELQTTADASDDDEGSRSSAATLVEMSSVELEIGEDELEALSNEEDEGDQADSLKEEQREKESNKERSGRGGMRLRSKRLYTNQVGSSDDAGKLDESNIIHGKRGRAPVDYILLNEAIFGDLSNTESAKLDDGEDFTDRQPRRKKSNSKESEQDSSDNQNHAGDGVETVESIVNSSEDPDERSEKPKTNERRKRKAKEAVITTKNQRSRQSAASRRHGAQDSSQKNSGPHDSETSTNDGSSGNSIAQKAIKFVSKLVTRS